MYYTDRCLRILLTVALLACITRMQAQDNLDSLIKAVPSMPDDTGKVIAMNEISWSLIGQSRYDEAVQYANQALQLSEKLNYPLGQVRALTRIGLTHYDRGDFTEALKFHFHALDISERENLALGKNFAHNNIGIAYYAIGNFEKALEHDQLALKAAQELKSDDAISKAYNNIGNVHFSLGNDEKALEYYERSLAMRNKMGDNDKEGHASLLGNIGQIYTHKKEYGKALENYTEALRLRREAGYQRGVATSLLSIGTLYYNMDNYPLAIENYNKALVISREIKDKFGEVSVLANLGMIYMRSNDPKKAEEYLLEAKGIAEEEGMQEDLLTIYSRLSVVTEQMHRPDDALQYIKRYISMEETLNVAERSRTLALKEAQFTFEQEREKQRLEQEKKDAVAGEALKRQQQLTLAFAGGGVLLLLLGGVVFRAYTQKRRDNKMLANQKEQIEEKHREIQDSINYAKRIQTAILPSPQKLDDLFNQSFILFKPKAVVSGDFYWYHATPDKIIWTVSDCTGHGVPGAFMSMIGNAFLNEIVIEGGITNPGLILDRLREKVIRALEQQGGEATQKDGMDIALCMLNRRTNELQYAGAYNPAWIIKPSSNAIIELKADKMPIGVYEAGEEPFKVQEVKVEQGDCIYLFSDGYADQFGGNKGKKFKYSQMKELLLSLRNNRMEQQHAILDETFESWRGNLEQVDDVCVFGVRV